MSGLKIITFLLSAVGLTAVQASAGERILFSGRNGQAISFDFSRQVQLLPPELEENRLGTSSPADPGSFRPLGDQSLSSNALRRRKPVPNSEQDKDWLFDNPSKAGKRQTELQPSLRGEEKEKSAMMDFLRGDEGNENTDARNDDADDGPGNGNDQEDKPNRTRRQPMSFKELAGMADGKSTLFRKMEREAGFSDPLEKQGAMSEFLKADLRRQDDVRHRQSMVDFRQRIVNPFKTAPGGNGVFGTAEQGGEFGGIPLAPGLQIGGGTGDGGLVPTGLNRAGGPASANVFESSSMPANFGSESAFKESKPKRVRIKPLDLSIRKRDF